MAYIGIQPAEKFTSFATQEFSTSATTSYTLDHAVANENEIALFVNNVRQQPGSGKAYTASGTALTLSAATASTDTMYCIFLGRALQTVTPATNSITAAMVGNDLISGKTALTATPATTDELLISDAGTFKRIDASLMSNTPAFYAYLSSNQAISDSTMTKIQFNTEVYDSDGCYDNSTNHRFLPTTAGKYHFYARCECGSDASNDLQEVLMQVKKNGTVYMYNNFSFYNTYPAHNFGIHTIGDVDMNGSTDYLEIFGYTNTESGTPLFSGNSQFKTYFGAYRIIGV